MRVTNKHNLPWPVVRAVTPTKTPEMRRGGADISITELLTPPRVRQLREKHWDELEEDASDLLYSLYGTIGHDVLRRYAGNRHAEERHRSTVSVDGEEWNLSGQYDLIHADGGEPLTLSDYKFTSAWTFIFGKAEWEAQLNLYNWLRVTNQLSPVDVLQNVLLFRDWSLADSKRFEGYPQARAAVINQPVWPIEKTEAFIHGRIRAHCEWMPECTNEEKMLKRQSIAVQRPGAKRALRLFRINEHNTEERATADAKRFADEMIRQNGIKLDIVARDSDPMRCARFCSVWKFCEFGRSVRARFQDDSEKQPERNEEPQSPAFAEEPD